MICRSTVAAFAESLLQRECVNLTQRDDFLQGVGTLENWKTLTKYELVWWSERTDRTAAAEHCKDQE